MIFVNGWRADTRGCRFTRVRLRGHLEACGAGDEILICSVRTVALGRCDGALVDGDVGMRHMFMAAA